MNLFEKIDFLSEALLASTGITTFYFRTDCSLIRSNSTWENSLSNFFWFNSSSISQVKKSDLLPFIFFDSLYMIWFIQPYHADSEDAYLVLGPIFETSMTQATFKKQMDIQNMSVSSQISFLKMTKDIPILSNKQLFHYGAMFHYALYGGLLSYDDIYKRSFPASHYTSSFLFPNAEKFDIPASHGSQMNEKMLLKNVQDGNIHYTSSTPNIFPVQNTHIGTLCPGDPLRQAKNAIIIYTALVTRAAVEGGLSVEHAYSLSDYYIQNLELTDSVNKVYELSNNMYDSFVRAVHHIRHETPCSQTIQYIMEIIHKHIYEKLDINALANEIGYSTYYMTKLFKKETGISVKQYILNKKIENAKMILETTNIDISDISDSLSFHSPSYFSTVFKKVTGVTPAEYRKTFQQVSLS